MRSIIFKFVLVYLSIFLFVLCHYIAKVIQETVLHNTCTLVIIHSFYICITNLIKSTSDVGTNTVSETLLLLRTW